MAHICTHSPPEPRSPLARAPAHACTHADPRIEPHRQTPKDPREIRSRGGPATKSGQPPPRDDRASLGCSQRGRVQNLWREVAIKPLCDGRKSSIQRGCPGSPHVFIRLWCKRGQMVLRTLHVLLRTHHDS